MHALWREEKKHAMAKSIEKEIELDFFPFTLLLYVHEVLTHLIIQLTV